MPLEIERKFLVRGDAWRGEGKRDPEEAAERPRAERRRHAVHVAVDGFDRQPDGPHHQRKGHDRRGQGRARPVEGEDDADA